MRYTAPLPIILALGVVLAWPAAAGASAESGAGSGATLDFIGKVINFLVLFGGLAYLLRKPLAKFLGDRAEAVRSGLQEADDANRSAQAKLQAVEERAGRLQQEVEDMGRRARAEGQAERDRILQAARKEADRLRDLSQQEIESLRRAGIRELKEYAMDKALLVSLDWLQARLTAETHSRLIDSAIDKLAEVHEKRDSGPALRPRTH